MPEEKVTENQTENVSLNEPKGFDYYFKSAMWLVAVVMSAFHVFTAINSIPSMEQRCIHVGFALTLTFMQAFLGTKNVLKRTIIFVFIVGTIVSTAYVFDQWHDMIMRIAFPDKLDIYMGCIITIALLEAARRKLGLAMPLLAILFILYALYGKYLPQSIGHRGYTLKRVMSVLYMELSGIYGQVAGISTTYIFLFVLFGAFLENSGAGQFFINLSTALVGKSRGGSAKVTTVASCLFGMVSGSAVANVMTVGPLTIPMMEQSGYSKRFSGAITSVAGTGGQFMPPIMGAAAFIISEKANEIAGEIMEKLDRGATGVPAVGMYTGQEKLIVYCVVSRKEIVQVKDIAEKHDPSAFVIVSDAREVLGEGFQERGGALN